MAVNKKLLDALERKSGLSRSQINRRIAEEAATKHLSRDLAAVSLAASFRLPIHRLATPEQLAQLRGVAQATIPAAVSQPNIRQAARVR